MDVTVRRPIFVAFAVVAVAVSAGCLSGPLGGDTGTEPGDSPTTEVPATSPPTTESRDHTDQTPETSSTGGSSNDRSKVDVAYLIDGPDVAEELPAPVACEEGGWVSFWGTSETRMLWEPGDLRVGWTVPSNQSTLFVAFENSSAVGTSHEYYQRSSVTADGAGVPVDEATGEGRYAVVMMLDVNGNGEYDPGTDRPCESDDGAGIAMTEWIWVDWNTTR
jgi:hypothetical protein